MPVVSDAIREEIIVDRLRNEFADRLKRLPIVDWPPWSGRLFGIHVPQAVVARPVEVTSAPPNIKITLSLLQDVLSCPGDVAECGVFRGASLIPMGRFLADVRSSKKVYGFDSFQGFDEAIHFDMSLSGGWENQKKIGGFSQTSKTYVSNLLSILGLSESVHLVQGYFRESLKNFADHQFCFVHLDCDLFSSYRDCLHFFYPRLANGGVILFDEYEDSVWPGCKLAVDDFIRDLPEPINKILMDGYVKFYLRKAHL